MWVQEMKHLISATLSLEAGQVWEAWPTGSRSRMLSELLANDGIFLLKRQADLAMIGSLRGNIATHRRQLADFLHAQPPLDGVNARMFARIIFEMNEDLDGSIHHDPVSDSKRINR
jgi:hypothetical protein